MRASEDASLDPDNSPPRSRLFLVVPKSADGAAIEAEMARFPDMQYCKTDLVASKGIVFVKYARSSSAAAAMEAVQASGLVAGYRVKCMLAEPKVRRSGVVPTRMTHTPPPVTGQQGAGYLGAGHAGFSQHQAALQVLLGNAESAAAAAAALHPLYSGGAAVSLLGSNYGLGVHEGGGAGGSLTTSSGGASFHVPASDGLGGLGFSTTTGLSGTPGASQYSVVPSASHEDLLSAGTVAYAHHHVDTAAAFSGLGQPSGGGFGGTLMGDSTGFLSPPTPSLSASSSTSQLSRQRLFVVLHKSVGEETLACLFRTFSGMEYCDLKKDRTTGRSKGYAYVKYASQEAAAAAQQSLNGAEFPPGSGCRMKVMFAEPALHRTRSGSADSASEMVGTPYSGNNSTAHNGNSRGALMLERSALVATPDTAGSCASTHLVGSAPHAQQLFVGDVFGASRRASTPPPLVGRQASAASLAPLGSPLASQDTARGVSFLSASTTTPQGDTNKPGANGCASSSSSLFSPASGLSASTPELLSATGRLAGLRLDSALLSTPPASRAVVSPPPYAGAIGNSARAATPSEGDTLPGDVISAGSDSVVSYLDRPTTKQALVGPGTALTWGQVELESATGSSTATVLAHHGMTAASSSPSPQAAGSTPTSKFSDGTVVYSALSRPLPDYALGHVFSQCGPGQ